VITILHLAADELNLNGEQGNLLCLQQRLRWSGLECEIVFGTGRNTFPSDVDAVFIGSGTASGADKALADLQMHRDSLRDLANSGTPFLALGLGWEILGHGIEFLDGREVKGIGIFPSRSKRVERRASCESSGYDSNGSLTTGYANHQSDITLDSSVSALVRLEAGHGNSSTMDFSSIPGEGLLYENLMAARLNGPLLPMNPHLADQFIGLMASNSGFKYEQKSTQAKKADAFAAKAREELRYRLLRK
jgi:lipid II isoglutaminyl synthase (glutamine-hydrolysing)